MVEIMSNVVMERSVDDRKSIFLFPLAVLSTAGLLYLFTFHWLRFDALDVISAIILVFWSLSFIAIFILSIMNMNKPKVETVKYDLTTTLDPETGKIIHSFLDENHKVNFIEEYFACISSISFVPETEGSTSGLLKFETVNLLDKDVREWDIEDCQELGEAVNALRVLMADAKQKKEDLCD